MHAHMLEDGSLRILDVNRGDAGIYACTPANDAREDLKQEINLTVRSMKSLKVLISFVFFDLMNACTLLLLIEEK